MLKEKPFYVYRNILENRNPKLVMAVDSIPPSLVL